jgi:ABC-type Na+ transport system ATPase subunit NatA
VSAADTGLTPAARRTDLISSHLMGDLQDVADRVVVIGPGR